MTDKNNNKPGFKKTKCGWIPKDWECKKLGNIAYINPSNNNNDINKEICFIPMSSVSEEGKINKYIIKRKNDIGKGYTNFKKGDILVAKITPCFENNKRAFLNDMPTEYGFGSTEFHVIRPHDINEKYCFYNVLTYRFNKYGEINMTGSAGQKRVPTNFIKSFPIPIPPIKEQEKIAEILGTWDKAIEQTEKLIEAKEKQFQYKLKGLIRYIMNLDNAKRVILKDILSYEQPTKYTVKSTNYSKEGKTPVLTANKSFILGYTDENTCIFNDVPVIIFDDFTTDMKFVDFPFKVKSSAMKILKMKGNIDLVLVYWLMTQIKTTLGGHKRYWISEYQYNEITLPNKSMQIRISNILKGYQNEIICLKKIVEMYKIQKEGLMQKLLTGILETK